MKISVICFSLTGQETGSRLAKSLEREGFTVRFSRKSRYLEDSIQEDLKTWTKNQFIWADGIIFVGACGIAVRSIAPFVQSKKTDPAVLVIDECGTYVISLLSGHLGGANELSKKAAEILRAVPIVTTATDLHGRFAVDVFAKINGCKIFPMSAAKVVSAALLAGKNVGFYSEFPFDGKLPKGLVLCDRNGNPVEKNTDWAFKEIVHGLSVGISVSIHQDSRPFSDTVFVVPPVVAIGVGCKKGKEKSAVMAAVDQCLEENGIHRESIACLASIDLKKEETGIVETAKELGVPFFTFSAKELGSVQGVFSGSKFVEQITGVENVCERSAVLAGRQGKLIQKKEGRDGVTTAAAEKKWRIRFE